jgi:selenocysteine lyase/cysteine desulfurase
VRVSFGVFNTPDDVDRVAGIIAAGLQAPASA